MSNNHLTQYFIIGIIALAVIIIIVRHIIRMHRCNNPENVCQCCPSKSLCGKAKKSTKSIADIKK